MLASDPDQWSIGRGHLAQPSGAIVLRVRAGGFELTAWRTTEGMTSTRRIESLAQ